MKTRVLILGGTGMLGHTLFSQLMLESNLDVYATARSSEGLKEWFPVDMVSKIRTGVDADNFDTVIRALASIQPDVVINCIGLIKQLPISSDPLSAITVNSLLPHRISLVCRTAGARLIHISTDCVFNGSKGNYTEQDPSDAQDLYGRSKFLGEVSYPHCVTMRTSIIGHELKGKLGLIEWFLAQKSSICGFTKAIYSGFPTVELARIIREVVLPNKELSGVYHVSSEPISKYDLLNLVAAKYGKIVKIEPFPDFVQDRSLNSDYFRQVTGYKPPSWEELINGMYSDFCRRYKGTSLNPISNERIM
ncbi:dTDP-4-dehydrorhamnose reductase family protein [Syntrophomonas wolfei]|uniref:dTDP-4-dehydrorhamnose reductase family protein n=1 Tax=Syntrophomonas wolfei TaxID=863 RepID=UPI0009EC09D7|nr:SDR family oxidoreductase [Syntrophomonas wolfei]